MDAENALGAVRAILEASGGGHVAVAASDAVEGWSVSAMPAPPAALDALTDEGYYIAAADGLVTVTAGGEEPWSS